MCDKYVVEGAPSIVLAKFKVSTISFSPFLCFRFRLINLGIENTCSLKKQYKKQHKVHDQINNIEHWFCHFYTWGCVYMGWLRVLDLEFESLLYSNVSCSKPPRYNKFLNWVSPYRCLLVTLGLDTELLKKKVVYIFLDILDF